MRILIIEDNQTKLKEIESFILQTYKGCEVSSALSYTSGLKKINEGIWDLILLDMSLPVYDISLVDNGGDKKPLAGKEIMKRMLYRQKYIQTIIITQFDTFGREEISISKLNEFFSEKLCDIWKGTINYDNSKKLWKTELKSILDKLIKEK